jgi:hypothetical protein
VETPVSGYEQERVIEKTRESQLSRSEVIVCGANNTTVQGENA